MRNWGAGLVILGLCLGLGAAGGARPARASPNCVDPQRSVLTPGAQQCAQATDDIVQKISSGEPPPPGVDLASTARGLKAEGFRCQPPSTVSGLTCFGKLGAYPKEVSIVIPPSYQPTRQAETILFLHGNNFARESLEVQNARTHWGAMLADTGRNQILVAPLSHGKTEDFEKSLATAEHFVPFQQSLASLLNRVGLAQEPEIGQITLTGHSGAYRPLAAIAKGGWLSDHIHELALFDSAYGRGPEFTEFAAKKGNRFWSAYNPNDPDLRQTNQEIMENLRTSGRSFLKAEKERVGPEVVRSNSVGFIPTNGDHYGAIPTYFRLFLKKK